MQVVQSRCYEAATAYWRRIKTDPDAETMGVLYWQLNDIWQVWYRPVHSRTPSRFPLPLKSSGFHLWEPVSEQVYLHCL